jgi:hypothetical protein
MFNFNQTLEKNLTLQGVISEDEMIMDIYQNRLLRDYSNYELTLMIEASIGLDILIPFALDLLQENIFSEGDASLLNATLAVQGYWELHAEDVLIFKSVIEENIDVLNSALAKVMDTIKYVVD